MTADPGADERPRIAIVSRELAPFDGGGIGLYVAATARTLSTVADVTILTTNAHTRAAADLGATCAPFGDARLAFVQAPAPGEAAGRTSEHHLYAERVLERLRSLYPDRGPDLVEVPDFLAEGALVVQARRALDPFLRDTTVAVRLHVSAEMCLVSDGHLPDDAATAATLELERSALRDADVLLASTRAVGAGYERFYRDLRLAPMAHVPLTPIVPLEPDTGPAPRGPLRILHVGRLERRKNVHELVTALTALEGDWRCTILGADTPTGPLGTSMLDLVSQQIAGDPRFEVRTDPIPIDAVGDLMRAHDLVVSAAPFETGPYTALHALALGVPVLGLPGGGLDDALRPGVTGWRARGPRAADLRDALAPHVAEPGTARALRGTDALAAHVAPLFDEAALCAAYTHDLTGRDVVRRPRRRPRQEPAPLVSVVVPYHRMHHYVEDTLRSALAQTHDAVEVIVVNDGSFEPEDRELLRLSVRWPVAVVTQPNQGLGAARNAGIAQARGRYVLPLDADNLLEPTFVARCVEILESDPDVAYVTSWNRYVEDDGEPRVGPSASYHPFGNDTPLVERLNTAGDAVAVLRRSVFETHRYDPFLTSFEDWSLYRRLRRAGLYGRVVPEPLVRYRVRGSSMLRSVGLPRAERLAAELRAADHREGTSWT